MFVLFKGFVGVILYCKHETSAEPIASPDNRDRSKLVRRMLMLKYYKKAIRSTQAFPEQSITSITIL